MKLAYLSFSETGYELAKRLAAALGGDAARSGQPDASGTPVGYKKWTKEHFSTCDGLIFVGAMGIAVRAIAPYIKDKTTDPAVIVIDEKALHVIPVLSGHLGGANDLARDIAKLTGSDPVITTATDINGVFAVDEWSKHQNCVLLEPKKIVDISGGLLHDAKASIYCPWSISGQIPDGVSLTDFPLTADIIVDIKKHASEKALHLVPQICTLGVGCRKDTSADAIEELFQQFMEQADVFTESIVQVATIDLKKDEQGLIDFCKRHGWSLLTYSSEELKNVPGEFTASEFVSSVTGVDNVCERSAVLASGGTLIKGKTAAGGVTMALAESSYAPDWSWKY